MERGFTARVGAGLPDAADGDVLGVGFAARAVATVDGDALGVAYGLALGVATGSAAGVANAGEELITTASVVITRRLIRARALQHDDLNAGPFGDVDDANRA